MGSMAIFGWGHGKPMEHSSPGGHWSSKRHPSKLFHASQYGGFAGRFALFKSCFLICCNRQKGSHQHQQGEKREICTGTEAERGCDGMSVHRGGRQRCLPPPRAPSTPLPRSPAAAVGPLAPSSPQAPARSFA